MEVRALMDWYPAPAKLNLFLHVLGRRDDGYHLLQTVFRLIDRSDSVGIETTRTGVICRTDETPGIDPGADLCLRAARLLRDAAAAKHIPGAEMLGVEIGLEKRLPIGGGLGGGSSDAATVLLVLNRLWKVGLTRAQLMRLGLALGADIPVFLFGESALGEGVGERLTPLLLPLAWYLVLTPQVSVSTKEIFSSGALTRDTKPLKIPPFLPGSGKNDLQAVATALYPAVAADLEWLSKHAGKPGGKPGGEPGGKPGDARMTGSGACVFAEFQTEAEARAVEALLQGGRRGFVARGLDRHPLRDWAADE